MSQVGPREAKLREQREARTKAKRPNNPFEEAARGRDPVTPPTLDSEVPISSVKSSKSKRGRPRKPANAKVSRATLHRRQAEKRKAQ